jgi:hypothetical protein
MKGQYYNEVQASVAAQINKNAEVVVKKEPDIVTSNAMSMLSENVDSGVENDIALQKQYALTNYKYVLPNILFKNFKAKIKTPLFFKEIYCSAFPSIPGIKST